MSRRRGVGLEISVGVFVLAAAFFLAVMIFMSGNYSLFGETWAFEAGFRDVAGLKQNAPVFVAGTQLGFVKEIIFHEPTTAESPDTYNLTLVISLPRHVTLREGSRVYVSSQGFLGEMFVGIDPGAGEKRLAPGVFLRGKEMVTFADVQTTAAETLETVRDAIQDFRGVADFAKDREMHSDIRQTISNARKITVDLRDLIAENRELLHRSFERFDRLTAAAETNVVATTENLRAFSGDLRITTAEVRENLARLADRLDRAIEAGAETILVAAENARIATESARDGVTRVSEDLTTASASVRRITVERETDVAIIAANLRTASEELRATSRTAREILARIEEGRGVAGAMVGDDTAARDFRAILENSARASKRLEELIEEIKKNPRSFFKFSFF
jgi:phospholipid/cholesterol/gamma-HCH transport system substrate-binding protein